MICPNVRQNFRFSIFIGAAVLILCGYSVLFVRAEAVSKQEVLQTEEKASQLALLWQEDAVRQASELFQKAARDWEILKNFKNSAECLRETAKLKILLSEEKSALPLLEKSLRYEKAGNNLEGEADTLSLLTIILTRLGENTKSGFYQQKALKVAGRTKKQKQMAFALTASGQYFYGQRDFQMMLRQQEKALELFREIGDKKAEAEILVELAYSYIINNDRIRGRDTAANALEISKNTGNLRNQVFSLIVLGDSYQRMGEAENALKTLSEAKRLFTPDLDFFDKAVLYNRLGHYYQSYNELDEAKRHFQISYNFFDKADSNEGRSETLTVLGKLSILQDNLDEALDYFSQSRSIAEKSGDEMPLAVVNLRIGEVNLKLADYDAAENNFQASLRYYQKSGIQYRIAEVQEKLGFVYEKRKNYREAEKKYLTALELNRKVHSKFAQAENLFNLARLKMLQNDIESGIGSIEQSILLTESSSGETANSKLKSTYFSGIFDRYELYINFLMKMHKKAPDKNYAVEALQAAEKSRARSMSENLSLSEANFIKDADAETVRREKEIRVSLNAKADELIDLLSRNAEKSAADKISGEINELEHQLENIKAKLKQQSPIYSAIKNPAPFDVGEFQKNILDDNSLFLEFSFGKNESYLWLIGKTEVNSYVLPPQDEIEPHIEKLRELLASREQKTGETIENYQQRINEADKNYWLEARQLSNQLFGQIADKLSNKRLIIAPDGKLHYFPAAALPLPNSDTNEPILLTNEIIYEPSAQTLLLLSKIKNENIARKNLLVFSDPVFSADDSRLSDKSAENADTAFAGKLRFVQSLNTLSRLTASKDEADSISGIAGVSKTDSFSGFEANREQLLNLNVSDYKIIHFATHGLIDEKRPELSGIVLSRFDENGQKLNESFRIQDIYGLNLNADLVVLSACETGIGKEVKGEGVLSLNNAFLQIGARSVVSSLWKVDDNATRELMKNFYREMASANLTTSESLRQAQIKLFRNPQYKSPFYWAAFTIQGDFKNTPELSTGYNYSFFIWLISGLLLIFGIFGLVKFWKSRL